MPELLGAVAGLVILGSTWLVTRDLDAVIRVGFWVTVLVAIVYLVTFISDWVMWRR